MMLEARDLYCERDERTLFRGLSFTVDAGEWVQVTGGNGAGKTTLLRLLTGLARPDGGEVYWQGEPLRRVRDSFHRSLLWIGHQPGIKTRLTARENLHFFHPGDGARLPEALAQAGLAGFEDVPVARLSAGQQRRVALARLWLTRAALWVLDEPFTAIDVNGVARLTRRMAAHTAQGGMVILTTHQPLPGAADTVRRLALTTALVLYALRANIDLFYTPGEILYGKRETQQLPAVGQRLRVGGMVMPGSVRRDPDSLKVNFSLYDAEGSVTVSYEGILPDLFREGQGVVVQGTLEKGNHVLAHEVLAKHDENYTPPEVEKAMQENHRRPQRVDKDTSS